MKTRVLIGWNELVELPDWGVKRLRAKVDTGARTSALHVENVEELPHGRVRFDVVLHRRIRARRVHVTARIRRRGRVRSSNGLYEERIFVATRLRLGPVEKEIEVSLVDRGRMIHRMLLGRSALEGDFLIDVARTRVQSPPRHAAPGRRARKKIAKKTTKKKIRKKTAKRRQRARSGSGSGA